MINSLKYSIGKNLIKPTYPGRQDTQRTPLIKLLHFTIGENHIDLGMKKIIVTQARYMLLVIARKRKLKRAKDNNMRILQQEEKSAGLS